MERENLLGDAAGARQRVRAPKKNNCCFWALPGFVIGMMAYGAAICIYAALVQRWAGVVVAQVGFGAILLALWAVAVYSYVQVVRVSPGLVDSNDFLQLAAYAGRPLEPSDHVPDVAEPPALDAVKWCHKCALYKPDRAHHSSRSGGCVLRMDHYCPWVNNTVGLRNHKYFVLFLFWAGVVALYAAALIAVSVSLREPGWDFVRWGPVDFQALGVLFYCTIFSLTLLSFGGMHVWQLAVNCTTLESFKRDTRWDLGSASLNISEVMGDRHWFWPTAPRIGDGFVFGRQQPLVTAGDNV